MDHVQTKRIRNLYVMIEKKIKNHYKNVITGKRGEMTQDCHSGMFLLRKCDKISVLVWACAVQIIFVRNYGHTLVALLLAVAFIYLRSCLKSRCKRRPSLYIVILRTITFSVSSHNRWPSRE